MLNSTYSDGRRNFAGYSYPDFSLKSWGAIYTDFVGNVYSANQCILKTSQGGFTFTTSCGFGIFGTCWYPNFEARQLVRCDTNGVADTFWFSPEDAAKICATNTLTLSLTPAPNQKDPRPLKAEGKDGKSTYELIAKVTENGSPKVGVAVTFSAEPIANSGGHDHHDDSRPKGLVNGVLIASGVTEGNGEIKVTFQADQVAGTHVVAAFCDSCTNKSVTKSVDVKVPDLVSLQAGSGYTLEGNTSSVGVNHKGNHYFTRNALFNLQELIRYYNSFGWQPVGINDASLIWGGKFDSKGFWTTGFHDEHRIGEEVDIGFITGTNATKISKGYYEICREKKVDIPSTILWHDIPTSQGGKYAPHFHVRLSGTYTKGPAAGKYAKCDSDSKTK